MTARRIASCVSARDEADGLAVESRAARREITDEARALVRAAVTHGGAA